MRERVFNPLNNLNPSYNTKRFLDLYPNELHDKSSFKTFNFVRDANPSKRNFILSRL